MAGTGLPAGERRSRPRDEARRKAEFTTLVDDGEVRGFPLPEGMDWHPQTQQWWETWRRSPVAQKMLATDWDAHLDTALLHHAMWEKGKLDLAAEIRLRVAKFGATYEDRLRLKLTVQPALPADAPPSEGGDSTANVRSIDSRRSRLTG